MPPGPCTPSPRAQPVGITEPPSTTPGCPLLSQGGAVLSQAARRPTVRNPQGVQSRDSAQWPPGGTGAPYRPRFCAGLWHGDGGGAPRCHARPSEEWGSVCPVPALAGRRGQGTRFHAWPSKERGSGHPGSVPSPVRTRGQGGRFRPRLEEGVGVPGSVPSPVRTGSGWPVPCPAPAGRGGWGPSLHART